MQTLFSNDNQYLKQIRSLHTKKGRQSSRLFLAEGLRLAEEAVQSAATQYLLFADTALAGARFLALAERAAQMQIPCLQTKAGWFAKAATTEHAQGVLAVVAMQSLPLPEQGSWFAYTDAVSDPGNLGTILRTAHAAGCSAVLLSKDSADPYNPKTVRASMGAIFKLPFLQCADNQAVLEQLCRWQAVPLAATAGGRDIRDCAALLAQPHLWVLGAEADGVSKYWQEAAAEHVSLPMRAGAESLNVASAAAVLFYQSGFASQSFAVRADQA